MRIEAEHHNSAGADALAVYSAVLDAVRAETLVSRSARLVGSDLRLGPVSIDLQRTGRVLVVGAGKAALGMAQAIEGVLDGQIDEGVVVTKHGHGGCAERIAVLEAGHPVPDEASVVAGREVASLAARARAEDLVIALISGGASALMELPVDGVTLADLRLVTAGLLRSGATITELNSVRACLSRIKAGGLARLAAPARVVALVLSDVLGNPLDVIASGPCVDVHPDREAARAVLVRYGLYETSPPPVLRAIETTPTARRDRVGAEHVIIGDMHTALQAACSRAAEMGLRPLILTSTLEGEAREVGRLVGGFAAEMARRGSDGPDCLIFGGETTVTVRGDGLGGRSQEMACAAAEGIAGLRDVAVLCAGTDGTDGPTDAAGGLVDGATIERADGLGISVRDAIARSDSYRFLEQTGGLVKTGPTHSNVGDLVIVTHRPSFAPPDSAVTSDWRGESR